MEKVINFTTYKILPHAQTKYRGYLENILIFSFIHALLTIHSQVK